MTTTSVANVRLGSLGTMSTVQRVLTVHADVSPTVRFALLDAIEAALNGQGIERIWIDADTRPDLVVLAEF